MKKTIRFKFLTTKLGFYGTIVFLVAILTAINNYYFYQHIERSLERSNKSIKLLVEHERKFCKLNAISNIRYVKKTESILKLFSDYQYYINEMILRGYKGRSHKLDIIWQKKKKNWDKVVYLNIDITIPKVKSKKDILYHSVIHFNNLLYIKSIIKSMTFSIFEWIPRLVNNQPVYWNTYWYRSRPAFGFTIFTIILMWLFRRREFELEQLEKEKNRPGIYENKEIAEIFNLLDANNFEKFKNLKESGINFNAKNKNNDTALILYAYENIDEKVQVKGVEALIANGANVNIKNKEGVTALMLYAQKNLSSIVELLLKNGAKEYVDEKNKNGLNALALAVKNDCLESIKILTKYGANIKEKIITDPMGMSNDQEIKSYLHSLVNNEADKTVKLLEKILSEQKPIKYTVHGWDFDFQKEYDTFRAFMEKVKSQWAEIEQELYELSSNLHNKIQNFLFADKHSIENWCSKEGDELAIGWSSLDGLEKWCNEGNDPFKFKLSKTYNVNGKDIQLFGNIIALFKQEVQIRRENNILENIFLDKEEELDYKFDFTLIKLKGKEFYTDTEKFRKVLDIIFKQFQDNKEYKKVTAEVVQDSQNTYLDLRITQHDSFSNKSALELLEKINGGDFSSIKNNLQNLCDWSVESCYNSECFRVNFLKSSNIEDIESLNYKAQGFTHILRFYQ